MLTPEFAKLGRRRSLALFSAFAVAILPLAMGLGLLQILSRFAEKDIAEDYSLAHSPPILWSGYGTSFHLARGLARFRALIRSIARAADSIPEFVNRAHNDGLETLFEGGVGSLLLLLGFVVWLATATYRAFVREDALEGRQARAGAIAMWLLLLNSLWEYPLRTIALETLFGLLRGFAICSPANSHEHLSLRWPWSESRKTRRRRHRSRVGAAPPVGTVPVNRMGGRVEEAAQMGGRCGGRSRCRFCKGASAGTSRRRCVTAKNWLGFASAQGPKFFPAFPLRRATGWSYPRTIQSPPCHRASSNRPLERLNEAAILMTESLTPILARASKLSPAFIAIGRMAFVALLLALGVEIVRFSLGDLLSGDDPELSIIVDPTQTGARVAVSRRLMTSDLSKTDEALAGAREALRDNPLTPEALTLLARASDQKGDEDRASQLMILASRVNPKDLRSQLWLLNQDLRSARVDAALERIDVLLRSQSGQVIDQLATALTPLLMGEPYRSAYVKLLRTNPPWRPVWFVDLIRRSTDLTGLNYLFGELQAAEQGPTEKELEAFLMRLTEAGLLDEAHDAWMRSLPLERRDEADLLYNAHFNYPLTNLPFEWVITPVPRALAQVDTQNSARVS